LNPRLLCCAVLCHVLLCSGAESFSEQHKSCFEGQQSLMVQFKQRDVELMLVPVWVKDGAWQLSVEAMSGLLLADCCGTCVCVGYHSPAVLLCLSLLSILA
jgi:hypothetical protein